MLLHYFLVNFLLSALNVVFMMYFGIDQPVSILQIILNAVLLYLWYFIVKHKKVTADEKLMRFYLVFTAAVFALFTIVVWIKGGLMASALHLIMFVPLLPFLPFILIVFFVGWSGWAYIFCILILHCVLLVVKNGIGESRILATAAASLMVVCTLATTFFYNNRDEVRYAAHGFKYMNGYSSTDFTDYMVYSDPSKLVMLDHEPSLIIENESGMPVLDGAEACYPVYSAVAKAIYKNIDKIEEQHKYDKYNGKIVTFTNTVNGYYRLVDGKVDMLFGARPSKEQTEYAKSYDKTLRQTLIGKEAFVFFVENDNPVSDISSEQLRAIYHGDITNWKEVGGKNQAIVAFQRPEGSGSQTMMEYFMGDVTLKEPKSYEQYNAMDGIVKVVANYANEDGALGYSFRYFIEGLMQEKNVKILSIDGVYPTTENIRNGSYPLVTGLYCVTLENETNPNVEKVLDFLLSEDGQYIIEQTGYVGIGE